MKTKFKIIPENAIKIEVPDTRQGKDYTCGASALQAVCGYFGLGPDEEYQYVEDMKMGRGGSDPEHIIRAAKKYGLKYKEYRPMSITQLKKILNEGRPVIIMIQAWPYYPNVNYKNDWDDGHWIVAIGYDQYGVYFEDPSLAAIRGFIKYSDLELRWHDIEGPIKNKVDHYGVVIWKSGQLSSGYKLKARYIE